MERQWTETPTRQVSIVLASTAKTSKILNEHTSALSAKSSASLATSTTAPTVTAKPPLRSAPATSINRNKGSADTCDPILFSRQGPPRAFYQEDPVISNYIPRTCSIHMY